MADANHAVRDECGYVYVASTESLLLRGIHKVGSTNDVERRAKDLGSSTSAPEPFFVEYFVRCQTLAEARLLEAAVKKDLESLGARLRSNREFFRTGTDVGIVGCIVHNAGKLGIEIVRNTSTALLDILENDRGTILSSENLSVLDRSERDLYFRGALDLAALLMILDTVDGASKANGLAASIYSRLDGSIAGSEWPNGLIENVEQAIQLVSGKAAAERFLDQVSEDRRDDLMAEWFAEPGQAADWQRFVDTDSNWPRRRP